jgi:hypothetical protein
VQLYGRVCEAACQVLALLPVDLDRLGDQAFPIFGGAVPELLFQCLVLEPLVLGETKLEREALGRALGVVELEAGDLEGLEAVCENFGVGGLDEVLNLGRALLEY